ncbi:MAG: M48 family metalloprotease [Immundisolibacteraceae bacterium]|nr:M48 family metalloprotease [Immundisolibacteraceae bacterium]
MITSIKNRNSWLATIKVVLCKPFRLASLWVGLLLLPQWLCAASVKLPDLGVNASSVFSPELDRRIGAAFMRQVRGSLSVMDDPEMQAYVRELGLSLASNSDRPELRFNFFLVDNPVINAFAGPGGNIGIHSGLVSITQSESELASVFAHEISHVTQRHLPRAFERQSQLSTPTLAAMIGALILTAANPEAGQAALLAVQGGRAQAQIDFTRVNEQEADRVGIDLLTRTGFNPRAMPNFFGRMAEASKFSRGNDIPEFLLTHPVTRSRISESLTRIEKLPHLEYQDSLGYSHFAARVRATLGGRDSNQVLLRFASQLKSGDFKDEAAHRYGYAYALLAERQYSSAEQQSQWLLKKAPHYLPYQTLKIRLLSAQKQYQQAEIVINESLKLFPSSGSLQLLAGEALMFNGKFEQAATIVEAYIQSYYSDPNGYRLQSRIAAQASQTILAYQMEAEHHYWAGDLRHGIQALREAARQDGVNFITLSKIENRLRFFQSELAAERQIFGG